MKPIIKNFLKHDGPHWASHIAFCTLLSIVPLMLITVSITGFLLGSSGDVYQQLSMAAADLFPKTKTFLLQNLSNTVHQSHSLGLWGVVILIFIATLLFGAIERALDTIFEAEKSRNFFHSRFIAILLIGIISLLFFMPTAADLLTRALDQFGFHFPLGEILRVKAFFPVFSFLAFFLIMLLIPHRRVRPRYAIFGGLFFAVALFVAKQFFRWYMLRVFDQYNVIYGSLTAIVLLLLWIYYAANILLFSAEIVAYLQIRHLRRVSTRSR